MPNNDFDRYDRNDPSSRSRLYEDLGAPSDRSDRDPYDRSGFPPVRRPYPDRDPSDRYGVRRGEDPVLDDPSSPMGGNVTITSPKSFMDVQDMIDKLRRNESIIVNLEGIELESAQRILDFLSGASYAIGGSMRRVKEMHSTFLVTPHGTGITDTNDDRYPR